jgi:hypothetical protein
METITLHVQVQDPDLIEFLKTLFRRGLPSCKPEEITYNLKQAATYVGESENH